MTAGVETSTIVNSFLADKPNYKFKKHTRTKLCMSVQVHRMNEWMNRKALIKHGEEKKKEIM